MNVNIAELIPLKVAMIAKLRMILFKKLGVRIAPHLISPHLNGLIQNVFHQPITTTVLGLIATCFTVTRPYCCRSAYAKTLSTRDSTRLYACVMLSLNTLIVPVVVISHHKTITLVAVY